MSFFLGSRSEHVIFFCVGFSCLIYAPVAEQMWTISWLRCQKWAISHKYVRLMSDIKRCFVAETSARLVVLPHIRAVCDTLLLEFVSVIFMLLTLFCHIVLRFTNMCDMMTLSASVSGTCRSRLKWCCGLFDDCGHEVGPVHPCLYDIFKWCP